MKRFLFGTLAAAAVSFSPVALTSPAAQSTQQSAADRETLLHAKLAGMKAGLALKPEQESLWSGFQSAVEGTFKSHTEGAPPSSPVDRVARGAAERATIAQAAKPLYDSFDDTQKRNFELLSWNKGMRQERPQSNAGGSEWDFHSGGAGYSWEPSGWDE